MSAGPTPPRWTVSVVSHGHGVRALDSLRSIHARLADRPHRLILTCNVAEDPAPLSTLPEPLRDRLTVIRNARPKGFGANHNAALRDSISEFVLMADPELRVDEAVFDRIEAELRRPGAGIVSPMAYTSGGAPQDNGRMLPTPAALLRRYLSGELRDAARAPGHGQRDVDWLAGLFLAMRTDSFRQLGGFDEGFYLYCEDVDLSLRARALGLSVALLPELRIVHDPGRRTLRRAQHLRWHLRSLLRLWRSPGYRHALRARRTGSDP